MDPGGGSAGAGQDAAFPQALAAGDAIDDPELAAAIEASFRSQTQTGMMASEDQMLEQALRMSRLEEEARQQTASSGSPAAAAGSASSSGGHAGAAPHTRPPLDRPLRQAAAEDDDEFSNEAAAGGSSHASSRGRSPGVVDDVDMRYNDDFNDPHLAAAIAASFQPQQVEEDLLQQALKMSNLEEESRQRAALREQQEQELQESILMDQMRGQEEKRRRVEEEERQAQEALRAAEDERTLREEFEAKQARVPPEPAAGEPGRVDLMIRTPDGKRIRRAFRGEDLVGQVCDYIDVAGVLGESLGAGQAYMLVSTMPRREYKDREESLAAAGLQGQCALLIERV